MVHSPEDLLMRKFSLEDENMLKLEIEKIWSAIETDYSESGYEQFTQFGFSYAVTDPLHSNPKILLLVISHFRSAGWLVHYSPKVLTSNGVVSMLSFSIIQKQQGRIGN